MTVVILRRKAVDDGAVTYTPGFYPESSALDGKFHDIMVHVHHPGSELRATTQREH